MTRPAPTLHVAGLDKSFGAVQVLHSIDLEIGAGQFVGLVGPNGSGKSTLIKVLAGVHPPSAGRVLLDGHPVQGLAQHPDVAFIHQDLGLLDDLSVTDNLFLGRPARTRRGLRLLDKSAEERDSSRALAAVGVDLDPRGLVGDLSPGQKALVAIARAFATGARILFVDEATSTLTGRDARDVVEALGRLVRGGATVVMVSHRLAEILVATERVLLLLDGRIAADRPTAGMGRRDLVQLLASHERNKVDGDVVRRGPVAAGPPVLTLTAAVAGRAGPVDLVVHAGEVLGLTGTPGSGLHDIGFMAHGSLRLRSGRRLVPSGDRVALVPPHRETQGGFDSVDVCFNLTISRLRRWTNRVGGLSRRRERLDTAGMVDRTGLRPASSAVDYGVLSGGNKQKVVLGRALFLDAQLVVLCEPTRGVDVAARDDLYRLVQDLPDERTGVLVITSDPEDLFALCDRVAVVSDGGIGPFVPTDDLTEHELESLL